MRKIVVMLIVAAVLVLALSVPALAEPSHAYAQNVVTWAHELKGPVPVDYGDGFVFNQLGKDVIPFNKALATEFGYDNYGQFIKDLAQQDK